MTEPVLARVRDHLVENLDGQPQVASVTFLGVEPIDVLRFSAGELIHYATLGCSRRPMTDPADLNADPVKGPRAELVMTLRDKMTTAGLHRTLAVLAATPAVEGLVLAPDALLDVGEPLWAAAPFTAVLLAESTIAQLPLSPPADPVVFLDAVPITATEAAWVRLRGAAALREAWQEAGIDVRDPKRTAAQL
ncbi:suppressor of fused domain protein [Skermania sp. ID1734]|uniref:suppressor of fused domain protein n=1 Tax=Skermania sp. ID1734 TaxID=2597516 RepID=UPI001180A29B|nr:suppressor of fused domain protein [Skermania sp. ID1734]TSE01896.1 suppressor of fused domain protein [Skermania sp. ID1734]